MGVLYEILTGSPVFSHADYPFPVMKRLFTGDMPTLPDSHGKMMKELIERCWRQAPEQRPSFAQILAEFQNNPTEIVPGARVSAVLDYIHEIRRWESEQ